MAAILLPEGKKSPACAGPFAVPRARSEGVVHRDVPGVRLERTAASGAPDVVSAHLAVVLVLEPCRPVLHERVLGADADHHVGLAVVRREAGAAAPGAN